MVVVNFFWYFKILLTNSFIFYKKYMISHRRDELSNYKFNKKIALAWLQKDKYWPNNSGDTERTAS